MLASTVAILFCASTMGQFIEEFDYYPSSQSMTPPEWSFATGDGLAKIKFQQHKGHATIYVDATQDDRNIWWALVRRPVPKIDINKLMQKDYELRVETKIKVSHAPRRVNLHFNHQRTTDYHSHLMEYDIPDTTNWHLISMTTQNFEVKPGDQINAQMALMDWGTEKYTIDMEYFKVDVVNKHRIGPDLGAKLPYHPPVPDPQTFSYHVPVLHDGMIDSEYPELNFNDWQSEDELGINRIIAVNGDQTIILRWDFNDFENKKINGSGLLELTTQTVERSPKFAKDFGMVRIVEILHGDPQWQQENVSYQSFCRELPLEKVLNSQMIIDYPVPDGNGQKALFTISQPVLQRLIDGKTLGIAIRPLGAVHVSFFASEHENGKSSSQLHFNVK